jgi:hypothetical protein
LSSDDNTLKGFRIRGLVAPFFYARQLNSNALSRTIQNTYYTPVIIQKRRGDSMGWRKSKKETVTPAEAGSSIRLGETLDQRQAERDAYCEGVIELKANSVSGPVEINDTMGSDEGMGEDLLDRQALTADPGDLADIRYQARVDELHQQSAVDSDEETEDLHSREALTRSAPRDKVQKSSDPSVEKAWQSSVKEAAGPDNGNDFLNELAPNDDNGSAPRLG